MTNVRITHPRLELTNTEWAAHRELLARYEKAGWTFRPGSGPGTFVA